MTLHDEALDVTSANVDWALGHDKQYIHYLCEGTNAILFQEAKNFHLADVLPEGWTGLQDTSDPGRMGACIAVGPGVEVIDHGITLGAQPVILGRRIKMLVRWIYWAKVKYKGHHYLLVSAHLPPARFKGLWKGYEKNLAEVVNKHDHTVVGTDANQKITILARRLGMQPHGIGIVGLLSNDSVHAFDVRHSDYGIHHHYTDHPDVSAKVVPLWLWKKYHK